MTTKGPNVQPLDDLAEQLRQFAQERDWAQFHTPRNLAIALSGEVGELLSLLQWVPSEAVPAWFEDAANSEAWRRELADVFAYLLQLANVTDVDLAEALIEKIQLNADRYPAALARGNATKYTVLHQKEDDE